MTRPLRHNEPGCDYHVYNRGANGQLIYVDDVDRQWFVRAIARTVSRHEVEILSFCLMGNHYHLLVRCLEACLDVFMRDLTSRYVRYFNERHGLEGRLCRDRYQSKLVASAAYGHTLGLYIHRNPKDLGYADRLVEYPWSSLAYLLAPAAAPWWLNPQPVLDLCGGPSGLALQIDRTASLDLDLDAGPDEIYAGWAVRQIRDVVAAAREGLNLLDAEASEVLNERAARGVALVVAREVTDVPLADLARHFGYSDASSLRRAVTRSYAVLASDSSAAHLADLVRSRVE